MITQFKIFENNDTEISFIINDLIPYFQDKVELWELPFIDQNILEFLQELIKDFRIVKFNCEHCINEKYGATSYINSHQTHKGKVRGYGFGMYDNKIHLTLHLDRIKYVHTVNTNEPIIIYDEIPQKLKDIIDDVNLLSNAKKYNL